MKQKRIGRPPHRKTVRLEKLMARLADTEKSYKEMAENYSRRVDSLKNQVASLKMVIADLAIENMKYEHDC